MYQEWFSVTNVTDADITVYDTELPGGTQLIPAHAETKLRYGPMRRHTTRIAGIVQTEHIKAKPVDDSDIKELADFPGEEEDIPQVQKPAIKHRRTNRTKRAA